MPSKRKKMESDTHWSYRRAQYVRVMMFRVAESASLEPELKRALLSYLKNSRQGIITGIRIVYNRMVSSPPAYFEREAKQPLPKLSLPEPEYFI